jgi:Tol biopolymer transport system component
MKLRAARSAAHLLSHLLLPSGSIRRPPPPRCTPHRFWEIIAMSRLRFLPIVVGALAVHAAAVAAQQAPPVRTLASFSAEGLRNAIPSPNGRFVLLATETELRMYDVASRQSWNLADGGAWPLPAWSARGDRIAWVREGEGGSGHYLWAMAVNPNTGRPNGPAQRVTVGEAIFGSFSPDGRLLAFAGGTRNAESWSLSVVSVTGGPERVVARFPGFEGFFWGAGGKTFYLNVPPTGTGPMGITKVRIDGGAQEVIPSPGLVVGMTANRRYLFVVPPNGTSYAEGDQGTVIDTAGRVVGHFPLPGGHPTETGVVLGDSAGVYGTITDHTMIEIRPITGGSARRLPLIGESDAVPVWSPDGTRIAFQVREGGRTSLAVMNADGTNPRVYRETDVLANENGVRWSPDSRFVACLNPDRFRMLLLDVVAGTIRTLLEDSIGGWRWRPDGQVITFRSRRMPGASIDEVTLNGQRRKLLDWPMPNSNTPWLFVGDSSIFVSSADTVAFLRPLGPGPVSRLASVPPGTELYRLALSNDRRWIGGLLLRRDRTGATFNQAALFSLATGARTVLDLPFSWMTGNYTMGNPPAFLPGDSALLVFGRRNGDTEIKLFRVPLNGDTPSIFTDVGRVMLAGSVFAASVSPDGRSVVYSVQPEASTASLMLIDLRGAIPRAPSRPPRR